MVGKWGEIQAFTNRENAYYKFPRSSSITDGPHMITNVNEYGTNPKKQKPKWKKEHSGFQFPSKTRASRFFASMFLDPNPNQLLI